MSSTQAIGGIISGYDTQSIIDATLSVYSTSIDNLEVDIQELELRDDAIYAVNNLLLAFSDSVDALASDELWSSSTVTSSNESALSATVDEDVKEGSYTFEVMQLAQAAQYTSSGVSDKDATVSPSEEGTITIESSDACLNNSTKLSVLNGGEGISHGIIRITDSEGNSAEIDLRGALTMDDILDAINNQSDANVTASINDDGNGLVITDNAGGTKSMKITDYQGNAAEDLGINGVFSAGVANGDAVYSLSSATPLTLLNDGQGINDGTPGEITITDSATGDEWVIDLSDCTTIGHIAEKINSETGGAVEVGFSDDGRSLVVTGTGSSNLTIESSGGIYDTTAEDLGIAVTDGGDEITGGKILSTLDSVNISSLSGVNGTGLNNSKGEHGVALGSFAATFGDGSTITFDFDAAGITSDSSVDEMLDYLNSQGGGDLVFSLNSSANGIVVENASGEAVVITDSTGTTAADLGVADAEIASDDTLDGGDLDRNYISRATSLEDLNGGAGVDGDVFIITDAGGFSAEIDISDCETLGDVIREINASGLDLDASINDTGDGIVLVSTLDTGGTISVEETDGGSVAEDLGLVSGSSYVNADGYAVLDGSYEINIKVTTGESLTDIMDKITNNSSLDAYIIDDGSEYSPYRLVINSETTGEASNFIISSNISALGFDQTAIAQDSVLLYGSQSNTSEPILLRSDDNTNSTAVIGMTLELGEVSDGKVTITVNKDLDAIVEAAQALVDSYNELYQTTQDMLQYVGEDDEDSEESSITGLLYGDSATRLMLQNITNMFMAVDTNNNVISTFYDLGFDFSLEETEDDEGNTHYYSYLNFDEDDFRELLEESFEDVRDFFYEEGDAALSSKGATVSVSGSSDGVTSASNLINGQTSSEDFGVENGYQAGGTIANGDNVITLNLDASTLMDYLVIYHIDSDDMPAEDYALRDFTVEYLDSATGKWKELREVVDNASSYTVVAFETPQYVDAIRITASETNAEDDIMRLVELKVQSQSGTANSMSELLNSYLDSSDGYYAAASDSIESQIDDIEETIEKKTEILEQKEAQLWSSYSAMEATLAALESQSSSLSAALGESDD